MRNLHAHRSYSCKWPRLGVTRCSLSSTLESSQFDLSAEVLLSSESAFVGNGRNWIGDLRFPSRVHPNPRVGGSLSEASTSCPFKSHFIPTGWVEAVGMYFPSELSRYIARKHFRHIISDPAPALMASFPCLGHLETQKCLDLP